VRAKAETLKQRYPDIDVDAYVRMATEPLSQLSPEMLAKRRQMIDTNLRAAMNDGESRIYPFKPFNAMMFEDMNNQGPFGAMILPFDYATYYETGEAEDAVKPWRHRAPDRPAHVPDAVQALHDGRVHGLLRRRGRLEDQLSRCSTASCATSSRTGCARWAP
jgi:hypothetical protein